MDCGICFYGSDDNMPEVFSETTRTARKVYTCCECRSPIQPGEQYEYVWGKWEGDTNTYRTCLPCVEIRRAFACDGSWTYTTLYEDLSNAFDRITTGCFTKLQTAAAKRKLQAQYLAWQALNR